MYQKYAEYIIQCDEFKYSNHSFSSRTQTCSEHSPRGKFHLYDVFLTTRGIFHDFRLTSIHLGEALIREAGRTREGKSSDIVEQEYAASLKRELETRSFPRVACENVGKDGGNYEIPAILRPTIGRTGIYISEIPNGTRVHRRRYKRGVTERQREGRGDRRGFARFHYERRAFFPRVGFLAFV